MLSVDAAVNRGFTLRCQHHPASSGVRNAANDGTLITLRAWHQEVNHVRLRMTTGPFPTFVQSGRVIEAPVGIEAASWSDLARHIYQ